MLKYSYECYLVLKKMLCAQINMESYTIDAMRNYGHKLNFLHILEQRSVFISCPYSPSTEIKLNNPAKFNEIFSCNLKNRGWNDDEINIVREYIFTKQNWLSYVELNDLIEKK